MKHTLKQARLIKAIPGCKTLKEAGEKAGYSFNARSIYRPNTKLHIKKALEFNEQSIKDAYIEVFNRVMKGSDKLHALDSMSRILSLFKDKQEITTKNDTNIKLSKEDVLSRINRISQLLDTKEDTKVEKAL